MDDCLFCKIVAGEIPSETVYDGKNVLAFKDVNPAAPVHLLVIPREHLESAADLGGDNSHVLGELFDAVNETARDAGIEDGYRVVTNKGAAAGQSVFHVHFHVMGGRDLSWPPG